MSTSSDNSIRILLIDRHSLVRAGMRHLIEAQSKHIVVGEAGNIADALTLAAQENPDIILMELDANREQGLETIRQLLSVANQARLLLVTSENEPAIHQRAAQFGAMGVVLKDQTADILFKAIAKVFAGEAWFDRMTMASVLTSLARGRAEQDNNPETAKIKSLSDREREIVALIGQGLRNKVIGEKLCISEVTVRHHLTSTFAKLGIADRLELVIYAYQNGLAQLPR